METRDIYANLTETVAQMRAGNEGELRDLHADIGDVIDAVFGYPAEDEDLAPDFSKADTYFKEPLGPEADKPAPNNWNTDLAAFLKSYVSANFGVDPRQVNVTFEKDGFAHVRIL